MPARVRNTRKVSYQSGSNAPYISGDRRVCRKIRCVNEEEFVIVGFTNPHGGRQYLGALLLAHYTVDGHLIFAGRAGTGMDDAELKRPFGKLKPLELKTTPLDVPPPRKSWFGSPLKLADEAAARRSSALSQLDRG
jgi:ATP-dependent DNA ligase